MPEACSAVRGEAPGDGGVPSRNRKAMDRAQRFSRALRSDGSIECWGDDTFGQASPP